jgi:hypothetical protein
LHLFLFSYALYEVKSEACVEDKVDEELAATTTLAAHDEELAAAATLTNYDEELAATATLANQDEELAAALAATKNTCAVSKKIAVKVFKNKFDKV